MIRSKIVVSHTQFFSITHFATTKVLLRIHLITYYERDFLSFSATKHFDQIDYYFIQHICISDSSISASSVLNANYCSCMRNCLHVLFRLLLYAYSLTLFVVQFAYRRGTRYEVFYCDRILAQSMLVFKAIKCSVLFQLVVKLTNLDGNGEQKSQKHLYDQLNSTDVFIVQGLPLLRRKFVNV